MIILCHPSTYIKTISRGFNEDGRWQSGRREGKEGWEGLEGEREGEEEGNGMMGGRERGRGGGAGEGMEVEKVKRMTHTQRILN